MEFTPKWKWFLTYLTIFFVVPIIGTLAHELGHYVVAIINGVPAKISYAYCSYFGTITKEQEFWFLLGGPISTWIVAIIGIAFILWKYRSMHSEKIQPIGIGQTISIVATAFSIRFIFNAGGYLIQTVILGMERTESGADEARIAYDHLHINPDILMYGSAIIGLILILAALYYIPRHQRYIILIAGIMGGSFGYLFWYNWVGPIVLP